MEDNFYVARAKEWLKKGQIERITSNLISITLGRSFNQPVESYLESNPKYKEYFDWWHSVKQNVINN